MTDNNSILCRLTKAVGGTDKKLFTEEELTDFASFYTDKWDENTSEDVIAEAFVDYWWETDRACRRCTNCGRLMRDGYRVSLGAAYYCSIDCLHCEFSDEEWEDECANDEDSIYSEGLIY